MHQTQCNQNTPGKEFSSFPSLTYKGTEDAVCVPDNI